MSLSKKAAADAALRAAISQNYRKNENECVEKLLQSAALPPDAIHRIEEVAKQLVVGVRQAREQKTMGLDAFLAQYDLSSEEGIALMCLAEALLRIPDDETIDRLIRDKLASRDWQSHLGESDSFFVNAATWGLMLTGKIISNKTDSSHLWGALQRVLTRGGEPLIRKTVAAAMRILGKQFVMGRTIKEALKRAQKSEKKNYRFSYDMLGEAARTAQDAENYFKAYEKAIEIIGKSAGNAGPILGPGISVKLSALHPRYEFSKSSHVIDEVAPRLFALAMRAKEYGLGLTVDAEEADRLDLSLDIIENVFLDPGLDGWDGFGVAIQAYQKRCWFVIDWLAHLTHQAKRPLMLRLVKGAYWDSEIKRSQELGLESYPVFTRKHNTDVSYLACAKKILNLQDEFYPQFATHNAHTVASILEMAGKRENYEFQCLHGMGRNLYDQIVAGELNKPCRIYAPVGGHEDLLAYLVRRLLENGANTSFINRIADKSASLEEVVVDPIAKVSRYVQKANPNIPLPRDIFAPSRLNSNGFDLSHRQQFSELMHAIHQAEKIDWQAQPSLGAAADAKISSVFCPSDNRMVVGHVTETIASQVNDAITIADAAHTAWNLLPVSQRAVFLERIGEQFEKHFSELMSLLIREAGKTISDAIGEIREAIDFCHYYAERARHDLAVPKILTGVTGENNCLGLFGRGVAVCISPWNFPLAIFTGQIVAALVSGNCVIAKPAEQTPLIAAEAVRLMQEVGLPAGVLQLLPGRGEEIGAALIQDERVKAVLFTGSTQTARFINQTLAARTGAIIPLIAETGGQNAMIADSSALPEQLVVDVINSAFGSAGQRCSALRVLFLQDDIADKVIKMLQGAMAELKVGDPMQLDTDVGPVIDYDAVEMLEKHAAHMARESQLIYQVRMLEDATEHGSFFAPQAYEIDHISRLTHEVFGPILHIIRYKAHEIDNVIEQINSTHYGLTLGIHSRINETIEYIRKRVHAGNIYVNRNMIGAVVGVQPFGGEGLSGTGPKAGGPYYLPRLCVERTVSINTTAAGGNATLMAMGESQE